LEHLAAFESVLAELRTVREEAIARAQAAEALADKTLALLADAQAARDRAEAALAGERQRADALRDRLDALRADDAARRGQGRWRRLIAAWRG
jgi:hypothetical protein